MDPKNLKNLDPKLKAAYERVMNSQIATPQSTPPKKEPIRLQETPSMPTAEGEKIFVASGSKVHKKSGLITILLTIGGIIFFLIYTIIWIKIFKLKVPILDQLPF